MSGLFNSDAINELLTFFKGRNEGLSSIGQMALTGSVASVTFDLTNYQQFRHLLLIANARTDRAATNDVINVRFNADAGNNYDVINIVGQNFAVASGTATAQTSIVLCSITGATATAGNFGGGYILFNNYTDTNMRKIAICASVNQADQTVALMQLTLRAGHRRNTAATTSLTLIPGIGPNFVANSIFALYGVY